MIDNGFKTNLSHLLRRVLMGLVPLLIILLLWYAVGWAVGRLRGAPFPLPHQVAARLAGLVAGAPLYEHSLYLHIGISLLRWSAGFASGALIGILYGLLAGRWHAFEQSTAPIVHTLQLVPGLAWVPIAILVFGVGEGATVFMVGVASFAPVAVNVARGVKSVDTTYLRAARMLGVRGTMLFRRVLLPGALPHVLSGLRVGLGASWRVLVAAEMVVATGTGLGYSIIQGRWTLDYEAALACVVVIAAIGLLGEQVFFRAIERRTIERWALAREQAL